MGLSLGSPFIWSGLLLGDDNQIAPRKIAVLVALIVWCGIQLTRFLIVIAVLFRVGLAAGDITTFDHFADAAASQSLNMIMVAGSWSVLHRATTKPGDVPAPSTPS